MTRLGLCLWGCLCGVSLSWGGEGTGRNLFPDFPPDRTEPAEVPAQLTLSTGDTEELPPSLESPLPALRLTRRTTPAAKMTLRRDPDPRRVIGDDGEGKSIRDVQVELVHDGAAPDNPLASPAIRGLSPGWFNEPMYGRYIFVMHDPLLFEDIPVERYGEECHPCVQPVVSFTKFLGGASMLPYRATTNYSAAKDEGAYTAYDHHGNLRPGVLEGYFCPPFNLEAPYPHARGKGYLMQAGTLAGILLFLP